MNISALFIHRPIGTTLLMVGLLVGGLTAYQQLPVAPLPQVDYPTIVVSTLLPGGSADTLAATVTTPLERQLGQIPGLTQMTSVSSFGSAQITLQFRLDRAIDAAEQDVQAALNATANLLPTTLPTPPTYSKSNPADTPVLTLAVRSANLPLSVVDDYADSILAQKISQVAGVGLVSLGGGQKPAVRVQVDPAALAAASITLEEVRVALAAANVNQPKGNLDGPRQAFAIATDDQLFRAEQYRDMVVAYKNGAPLRLRQVADVVDGVENAQLAGWANKDRAIILNVQRQPGANLIEVSDSVQALLPQLQASMPAGIEVQILTDRTQTIRASLRDVQDTLLLTIALVVVVIFAFLRDLRATLIPSVTVPLSMLGTFAAMFGLGYSLDNLSLMALTISTGFVVDDAIVMIENIARYLEEGHSPLQAALLGAKQIGFTIVSLTASLIAVLIPLLFMGGIIGRLFREFAVTLSIAIGVSAVLSLTLTPMMCALLLRPHNKAAHGRLYHLSEQIFEGALHGYDRGLRWVLKHPRLTLATTLATFALTFALAIYIPKGFFPQQDTGLLLGTSEASPDTSFVYMMERQRALADVLLADPDVDNVASFIGSDGTNPTTNSGRFSIALKPQDQRSGSLQATMARLLANTQDVFGISLFLQPVQDLQIDARASRTQYQYTLESANADELTKWAPQVLARMRALPQLRDVASDQQATGLEAHLSIDRDTASRLGIMPQAIDNVLYDAFGQRIVSTIFTQLNQYRVILEVKPEFAADPRALDSIYVLSSTGLPVPLSQLTTLSTRAVPLAISHQGQFPAVTLSFNLAAGTALGQAVNAITAVREQLHLPPGIRGDFRGTAQAFSESLASEPMLVAAAILAVYIVLGVLYESFIHPITILSTLPSAGIGALLALMVCQMDFDVLGLIGVILLIGIVKKNAIMMVDFALEAQRERGVCAADAIYQACLLRFRPIMMTTLAALFGGVPLAFGHGIGAELRRPLGICIVGGLIVSQALTLYTTPIIYLYMDKLRLLLAKAPAPPARPSTAPADLLHP